MASKKKKSGKKTVSKPPPKQVKRRPSTVEKMTSGIRNYWEQKSPVLKFLLGFAACMIVFYLIYLSPFFVDNIGKPILNAQAKISSGILNLFGQNTNAVDDVISGENFSVSIKNGCDGLETLAIMLSGIVVFPIAFRLKWPGLAFGTLALMVLNFFRIVGLYVVGLNFSEGVFDFLHTQGGFVIFTMLGVFLWIFWANWALNKRAEEMEIQSETAT